MMAADGDDTPRPRAKTSRGTCISFAGAYACYIAIVYLIFSTPPSVYNARTTSTSSYAPSASNTPAVSRTNATRTTTPHVLHQIVPANHTKDQAYMDSWNASDGLETILYGDDDLLAVVQALESPKLLEGWSQMARKIEQIDFVRYAILYLHGGIYADADQELVDPTQLRALLNRNALVLPYEKGGPWNFRQVGQALMISPPRHPFWLHLMDYMIDNYNSTCNVLMNTGPMAMTNFWNEHHHLYGQRSGDNSNNSTNHGNVVLTQQLDGHFDPSIYNESFTIHHMGGTWIKDDHREQLQACKSRIPWECKGCDEVAES